MREYSGLVKYLVGAFIPILVLHLLLYIRAKIHAMWKEYLKPSTAVVLGDVLSCDESSSSPSVTLSGVGTDAAAASAASRYQVVILYQAQEHKYWNNPRLRFRHPNMVETKRYVRRFVLDEPMERGTKVEIVLLPDMPRSGCMRQLAERNVAAYSRARTVLIAVPGLLLLIIFLGLCVREVVNIGEDKGTRRVGWVVLVAALVAMFLGAKAICQVQLRRQEDRLFNCAVPMKTSGNNAFDAAGDGAPAVQVDSKADPLLA